MTGARPYDWRVLAAAGARVVAGALAAAVVEAEDPEPDVAALDVPALDGAEAGDTAADGVELALADTPAVGVEEVEAELAVLARR